MENNTVTQFTNGWEAAWFSVAAFVPKFLAFLAILVIGYFVAMALGKVVDKVLAKVGFDRAVERSGIRKALSQSGYHPSQILGKLAFYTVFLLVLQLAFGVFGPNPISELLTRMVAFLPNVFVAVILVVLSASVAAAARDIVSAALGGLSYGRFLANAAGVGIVMLGVFAALTQLNIAPEIVLGLFYSMLAIIVGVSIVAIGGGGIQPMRARWESALNRVDQEVPRVKRTVRESQGWVEPEGQPAMTDEERRGYLG